MAKKSGISQKNTSVSFSSALGAGCTITVSLLLSILLAFLVDGQHVAYESIGMIAPIIIYLSHTLGGLISAALSIEKKAIAALISVAASFFILTASNILFWNSSFHGIIPKILSALVAYASVFLILLREEKAKRRPRKIRHR